VPDAPEGWRQGALAAFVTRDNHFHRDDIERQYRIALRLASERIVIANAYFFPGWRLLKDMRRAARRGVQVDLILQGEADMAIVKTAASMLHAHLVGAGVRVFEYCERPLHGKVAVVDDIWATVGSSNLDPISLGLNLEANVFVRDREFATDLRRRLDYLIEHRCKQVEVESPGWLLTGWISLRNTVVFHFLRRFPRWALQLPRQEAKVAPLQAKGT
jgi:cardiolipin synthase